MISKEQMDEITAKSRDAINKHLRNMPDMAEYEKCRDRYWYMPPDVADRRCVQ
jgi:hypothetical protein